MIRWEYWEGWSLVSSETAILNSSYTLGQEVGVDLEMAVSPFKAHSHSLRKDVSSNIRL